MEVPGKCNLLLHLLSPSFVVGCLEPWDFFGFLCLFSSHCCTHSSSCKMDDMVCVRLSSLFCLWHNGSRCFGSHWTSYQVGVIFDKFCFCHQDLVTKFFTRSFHQIFTDRFEGKTYQIFLGWNLSCQKSLAPFPLFFSCIFLFGLRKKNHQIFLGNVKKTRWNFSSSKFSLAEFVGYKIFFTSVWRILST